MTRKLALVALALAVALVGWLLVRTAPPPEIAFAPASRETIVSAFTTNGKVEPVQWVAVHAEVAGPVERVGVSRGDTVREGQIIAAISASDAQAQLSSAESRIQQARAELETLQSGGRAPEIAEIESGLARARADAEKAKREVAVLERLIAKQAASNAELAAAREELRRAQLQMESLELRRKALVTQPDRSAAQARLQEAQSGAAAASKRLADSVIRAPINGILYSLNIRPGDFVQPGAPVAKVGQLDRLRVILYVDEPELGRIAKGMPVTITWDAMPGREWKGTVESVPLQVVPIGSRQVGEVISIIENEDLSLIPGTNINAEIRSRVVESALTVPKEALRRQGQETGVFVLEGDRIVWRPVQVGVSSVTRAEILEGLSQGDRVALSADTPLRSGDAVRPVSQS